MNAAARRLLSLASYELPEHPNSCDLFFDPAGVRPYVRDWERSARVLLGRVQRDCLRHPHHDGLAALLERILTTLMTFSAPQTVAEDELQLELYFPHDEATEAACVALAGG